MQVEERKRFAIRILGVDPAAGGATGFGVVDARGSCCNAVHYGVLAASRAAAGDVPARLQQIHTRIAELIEEFTPDCVAVESIFAALNVKTALRLAEVRGVVLLAAAQRGLPVHSYSPREVKASVAGYGNAGKAQMQQMVRALLSLKEIPRPADAADALAVAMCHVRFAQTEARFGVSAQLLAGPHTSSNTSRRNPALAARIVSVR